MLVEHGSPLSSASAALICTQFKQQMSRKATHDTCFCITVWYKEPPYIGLPSHSALFSEVLTHYSHVSFSEDYRTMIYKYSNRTCSGFEKSNTGVLLTNQEDVNGPREMPKTLKMILK